MTRRLAMDAGWSIVALTLLCRLASPVHSEEIVDFTQPNIIVLLADDLGYGELGCQGNKQIPTPRIDSIADGGVRFTQGYVTASYCSPSRAGLLTGRYQTRFGYESNPIGAKNDEPGYGLPTNLTTLADALHLAGYTTGLIGKWHLGGTAAYHPRRRGFDEFYGFLHEGHFFVPPPWEGVTTMLRRKTLPGGGQGRWQGGDLVYSTHMGHDEPPYDANNPILRDGQPVQESEYLTRAITRESISFIERHRDKPFFLYVAYNAVHSPLQAPNEAMAELAAIDDIHRRIFAGMLVELDDSVGAILDTLGETDLARRTLVIFLSDNGGPTRELTSSNAPLRGEKGSMYEGGLRVPFMMQWPGGLPEGAVYDRPISSLDIFPTALAAADVAPPPNLDGVDLLPYLRGERDDAPHETFFWRQRNRTAVRVGDWKLVRNPGYGGGGQEWQLYNLRQDLGEENDLADALPEKLREMIVAWEELNAEMIDPLF